MLIASTRMNAHRICNYSECVIAGLKQVNVLFSNNENLMDVDLRKSKMFACDDLVLAKFLNVCQCTEL